MPKLGRVVLPNFPHHVVQRGHNKQVLFAEESDFLYYINTLEEFKVLYDVALLLAGAYGSFLDTKLELANIAYDVLLETGSRIQTFPVWEDDWAHPETYVNPRLLRNITREGIRR